MEEPTAIDRWIMFRWTLLWIFGANKIHRTSFKWAPFCSLPQEMTFAKNKNMAWHKISIELLEDQSESNSWLVM
jgi:hypothetical protein